VATNQEAARALVSLGRFLGDPFAAEVADTLLQRYFASEGSK